MKLKLIREEAEYDGIFGKLLDETGKRIAVTLEHSYNNVPKIPVGTYECKLSLHRLHGMNYDFSTYQVQDVPGHSSILFHWGNYNEDSDGCILLGKNIIPNTESIDGRMITSSKNTFSKFMDLLRGKDTFTLEVV